MYLLEKPNDNLVRQHCSLSTSDMYLFILRDATGINASGARGNAFALRRISGGPGYQDAAQRQSPRNLCRRDRIPLRFCVPSSLARPVSRDLLLVQFHCEVRDWRFLLCQPSEHSWAQRDCVNGLFFYKKGSGLFFFFPVRCNPEDSSTM